MSDSIIIKGARVNNLKNIDLEIPRGKFVVVTGISGSGKSSLAFDTLYAEGQRRFAESISSYARQFLGRMSKPDVDLIDGIPPAIAIEQKVNIKNPRSTVATTTEIYDFLRLIFARIGRTFSPVSGREVHKDSPADVMRWLEETTPGTLYILANLRWDERDDKVELMLGLKEDGYSRLYIPGNGQDDGVVRQIDDILQLDGNYPSDAWLLIDRLKVADPADYKEDKDLRTRLLSSISDAFSRGSGDIRLVAERPKTGAFAGEPSFGDEGLLLPLRTRRHHLPRTRRLPLQFQLSPRRLPSLRRPRKDNRHQRRPGDPRQDQKHLRRSNRLLAGRQDELVHPAPRARRPPIQDPSLRTLLQPQRG